MSDEEVSPAVQDDSDPGFLVMSEVPEEEDYSEFFPQSDDDGMDEEVYIEADTSTYEE